jgi:hypothetical protein
MDLPQLITALSDRPLTAMEPFPLSEGFLGRVRAG